jgi:hypothetical protein
MKTWWGHITWFLFYLLLGGCGDGSKQTPSPTSKEKPPSLHQEGAAAACTLTEKNGTITVTLGDDKNGQHTLAFVRINSDNAKIDIALRNADAEIFYIAAQQMWQQKKLSSSSPLLPWIWRAVSKNPEYREIKPFWIQQESMSSSEKLYHAIFPDGSADSVSDDDATVVIKQLNQWCKEKASFELPTEEQFVYLARKLYNPVKTGQLISCQDFRDEKSDIFKKVTDFNVNKLLGEQWQLTKSECRPFDPDSDVTCDERTYVKKGGTHNSRDATECTPEYRAESTPDIRVSNTTFRLVLTINQ